MDFSLSSVKDLFKDVPKLTLPGIVFAALLAIFILPPKPIDVVPVVQASSPSLTIGLPPSVTAIRPTGTSPDPRQTFNGYVMRVLTPRAAEPSCKIDEYYLLPLTGITGILFEEHNQSAQNRQYALEEQNENLERCLAAEKKFVGAEQDVAAALQRDLNILEATHATQAAVVAEDKRVDSPLIEAAQRRFDDTEKIVQNKRLEISKEQQDARDREWEIAELTRWKAIVSDRLADPGRLRPELGFDDYLSALSKHVMAFVFLAVAVGMVMEGISTPGVLGTLESILFGS